MNDYILPKNGEPYPFVDLLFNSDHLLIAGATGSGKSVLIDDIMYHLLSTRFPYITHSESVKFALIDPKRVSLRKYLNVPHVERYACETSDIIQLLDDVIDLMDIRYDYMQKKDITLFDGAYIVVVIDELADLMTTCKKDVLPRLQRIAQLGRAAKIKLIAATQAPSRKIIPAELTLNFTGRLALHCVSDIESKQIIKRAGAELLPRHGKALYLHSDSNVYTLDIPLTKSNLPDLIHFWENQQTDEDRKRVKAPSMKKEKTNWAGIISLAISAIAGVALYALMNGFY